LNLPKVETSLNTVQMSSYVIRFDSDSDVIQSLWVFVWRF